HTGHLQLACDSTGAPGPCPCGVSRFLFGVVLLRHHPPRGGIGAKLLPVSPGCHAPRSVQRASSTASPNLQIPTSSYLLLASRRSHGTRPVQVWGLRYRIP